MCKLSILTHGLGETLEEPLTQLWGLSPSPFQATSVTQAVVHLSSHWNLDLPLLTEAGKEEVG